MNLRLIIFFLFFLITVSGHCQRKQLDSLSQAVKAYNQLPSEKQKDTSYINLINKYVLANYYVSNDTVSHYANKSLKLSREIKYIKGEIESLINLGFYESESGNYDKGISYIEKAFSHAKRINSFKHMLLCYSNFATIYDYAGNIKKSVESSLKAIRLAEDRPNKTRDELLYLSLVYENLGLTYGMQREYDKALDFLIKAKEINEKTDSKLAQAQTLSNIASFQLKVNEFEKGMENVEKSIPMFIELGYKDWLAFAYKVKGELFVEMNEYEKALDIFMQSLLIYEKVEDKREKTSLLNDIAKTYCGMQEFDLAKSYADDAMELAKELNSFEDIKECSKTLYLIAKKTLDYENALVFHELFKNYNDSIFNHENTKSVAAHEAQMSFIAMENQLKLDSHKQLSKQRLFIYLSTGGVIILLTILFFTQRSRKVERKLNGLLANKNHDLKKREQELQELNETKNKFFSIIAHDLRAPIGSLNSLIDLLKDNQISAKDFMQFAPKLSEQVKSISFTLNNLLVWGQAQMKGANSRPSKIDLQLICADTINLLKELASKKKILIKNIIPDKAIVFADHDHVNLVFRNIINNAIKFTPETGLIEIYGTELEKHWKVEIRDSGIGMSQKAIDTILSDKTQFDSTYGTNNEKGTGLGLNLCKEMIKKNHGKLWIKSEIGKGTSFFFTLPKK
ncbi:tetratricopeptide repeat-containing sensor histidine kinase [Galbibacter sp. BG1]|uniref:tetratricopeptide repeat-containing sensor histidine kinase n=1 Tax=Galbibacter sp. BG1 TaxID=1170699 RepID=UPI0015B94245|nr:tetratricopeptide repeat-containing sensor histidine kinase [Galbibacter sp. BG1]QLE02306.1 tetratricopeptide repeat-containing sensor histidine kinase [Galbibacter sp. BG1]